MNINDAKSWTDKLGATLREDPKKAGILGVLALLLAVLVVRAIVMGGSTPARAGAAAARTNVTVNAHKGVANATPKDAAPINTPRSTDAKLRQWLNEPIRPISRNLFAIKLEYFPRDGTRAPQGVRTARDGEFWGQLEKSLMLQADQRDKRENLLANFKAEAGKLRLDSIMMGPTPKAMIEGNLVTEGDVVAQFRVLKIEARRITVERDGIRLEIQMK